MQYLWDTTGSIPDGVEGFELFGPCHLAWLLCGALCIGAMCLLYRRLGQRGRIRMRWLMAAAVVAGEAFKFAVLFIGGNFTRNYLPFHLCSINVFVIAWHAWRPRMAGGNYLYAICIPAALMALFFPNWTSLPLMNLMHIHSFTFHILLVCYPAVLIAGGDIRPQARCIPQDVGILAVLAFIAAVVNSILDTNYMFLQWAPDGNPLKWFEEVLGHHLWGYAVLLPLVLIAMYARQLWRLYRARRHK